MNEGRIEMKKIAKKPTVLIGMVAIVIFIFFIGIVVQNQSDFSEIDRQVQMIDLYKKNFENSEMCKVSENYRLIHCFLSRNEISVKLLDVPARVHLHSLFQGYRKRDIDRIESLPTPKQRTEAYLQEEFDYLGFETEFLNGLFELRSSENSSFLSIRIRNHWNRWMSSYELSLEKDEIMKIFEKLQQLLAPTKKSDKPGEFLKDLEVYQNNFKSILGKIEILPQKGSIENWFLKNYSNDLQKKWTQISD